MIICWRSGGRRTSDLAKERKNIRGEKKCSRGIILSHNEKLRFRERLTIRCYSTFEVVRRRKLSA
jgi:hypothetical protein